MKCRPKGAKDHSFIDEHHTLEHHLLTVVYLKLLDLILPLNVQISRRKNCSFPPMTKHRD